MSTTHYNKLNPAEAERLAILGEECGEVMQIIGKILRHGWESTWPEGGPTNRQRLESELGDIRAIAKIMETRGDVSMEAIMTQCYAKQNKILVQKTWVHHQ